MKEVWVIVNHNGVLRRAYGWFETEQDCSDKCVELRKLRVLKPSESNCYTPRNLLKNDGLGKN
jgi:hypothetical protein